VEKTSDRSGDRSAAAGGRGRPALIGLDREIRRNLTPDSARARRRRDCADDGGLEPGVGGASATHRVFDPSRSSSRAGGARDANLESFHIVVILIY